MSRYLAAFFWISGISAAYSAEPSKVDFIRDVQPIFKAHCYSCHGPKQQKNGLRLDRRRDAMRGGTIPLIAPGNSAASWLYKVLVDGKPEERMPPDGTMSAEEIKVIKDWIDQGAKWPDAAAGEAVVKLPDARAVRLLTALRDGDTETFRKLVKDDPKSVDLKGEGGVTPLMFAVLYGNANSVRILLEANANVNDRNDSGATALMWAIDDLEKTRLLLKAGADVNARSDDGRTPLLSATWAPRMWRRCETAAGTWGETVGNGSQLSRADHTVETAADLGETAVVKHLIEKGADIKGSAPFAVIAAINANNPACADMFFKATDANAMGGSLLYLVPPRGRPEALGNIELMKKVISAGANVNAKDPAGRTPLMLAAASEYFSVDAIQFLLTQGADVNAKSEAGETALDFAQHAGQAKVSELLVKNGGKSGKVVAIKLPKPSPAATVRAALERSLPLLQKTDEIFAQKSGCVSCHNNSLTAMSLEVVRKYGLTVDEKNARAQSGMAASFVELWQERSLQMWPIPGDSATVSYILVGLAAGNHAPNVSTEAWARYLKNRQTPDGRWADSSHRPPMEASDFQVTATSLRAMKAYAPKSRKADYDAAIQRGADWLKKAKPATTEDRAFQILGLVWAGGDKETIRNATRDLLALQHPDGGWSQHASLTSDAYATGQSLVALHTSGMLTVADKEYRNGVKYLMSTQMADGSWYVRSRSIPFQPYFESGFPHGHDQWISVAATNWAVMALAPTVER